MHSVVWLLAAGLALAPAAHAAQGVDLTLVLVSDVSRSIDNSEFKLEKDGYATAFTSKQVVEAIHGGAVGAIAVSYVEFASSFEVRTVLDWQVIRDRIRRRRSPTSWLPHRSFGRTAISAGVDHAVRMLAEAVRAPRHMIDVCGDGTNNAGRDVTDARDDAVKAGITITASPSSMIIRCRGPMRMSSRLAV